MQLIATGAFAACHTTTRNAQFIHAFTSAEWGDGSPQRSGVNARSMATCLSRIKFRRHHTIAKKSAFLIKYVLLPLSITMAAAF